MIEGTPHETDDDVIATCGVALVVVVPLDVWGPVAGLLDPAERERASRFLFDRDRRRFVASHTALRVVLGHHLGVAPESLHFVADAHGKPRLADDAGRLRFNLSHSGERALIAVTVGPEVGVDIEEHRPIDFRALAKSAFSIAERDALERCAPENLPDAFYRCWTRKESFIKARGEGLSCPLHGFDVSNATDGEPLLLSSRVDPADVERWTIVDVPVSRAYSAALTIESGPVRIVMANYSSGGFHQRLRVRDMGAE